MALNVLLLMEVARCLVLNDGTVSPEGSCLQWSPLSSSCVHTCWVGSSCCVQTTGLLRRLINFKEPEGQLARWLECLQEFTFQMVHWPGKSTPMRMLSHIVLALSVGVMSFNLSKTLQMMTVLNEQSPQTLCQLQLDDPTTGVVLQAVEKNQKPEAGVIARGEPEVRRLIQLWDRLLVEEGLLKRKYDSEAGKKIWMQLVVPHALREEIIQELHAGPLEGHLGEDKTLGKVKEWFYWPGMQQDVAQWIRTCSVCTTHRSPPQQNRAPLQTCGIWFSNASCCSGH